MNWKRGKYVGHKFTEKQKRARRMWRACDEKEEALIEAFLMSFETARSINRDEWHERLDKLLDGIERNRQEAKELFSEVRESFTIASVRI